MQKRVAVIRGGIGDEYDVSLKTGAHILSVLNAHEHYQPIDVYIDKQGVWYMRGKPVPPVRALSGVDAVWNGLHGMYGEDGEIQKEFERIGVPYTGSGSLASGLAMNKVLAKEMLQVQGVSVPRASVLTVSSNLDNDILHAFRTIPLPVVIKPASSGSSVGITIARNFHEFTDGVKKAFKHSAQVMVEQFIKGKEATAGVIDTLRGEKIYTLPPVEITAPNACDFFDYHAKYSGESTEQCPGSFSKTEVKELQRLARLAHDVLGLKHYSRSDFIVSPGGIYFLETNTLPGLTEESLLPKSLQATGVSMEEFIDHVLKLAIEK